MGKETWQRLHHILSRFRRFSRLSMAPSVESLENLHSGTSCQPPPPWVWSGECQILGGLWHHCIGQPSLDAEAGLMLSKVLVSCGCRAGCGSGGLVWTPDSSPPSNDPLLLGNCCLGSYSSLCSFQEPAVVIKVVPSLAVP